MFGNIRFLVAFSVATLLGGTASAQEYNNELFIIQNSGSASAGQGNTLFVDQSAATGSWVGGSLSDDSTRARQIGQGNEADIQIVGSGGQVALNQISADTGGIAGNSGDIDLAGSNARASLFQDGSDNSGTLFVNGENAFGSLKQVGDSNIGEMRVIGDSARGTLKQSGNNITGRFKVTGTTGTDVTVIQRGDNLQNPPEVTSNGGTVIITQTASGI